jgi:hypothetical protein
VKQDPSIGGASPQSAGVPKRSAAPLIRHHGRSPKRSSAPRRAVRCRHALHAALAAAPRETTSTPRHAGACGALGSARVVTSRARHELAFVARARVYGAQAHRICKAAACDYSGPA